jgi:hypothetical protein
VSVPVDSELELLFALAAFMGVTTGICRCCMMRSMFFSMDLRQSLSCSGCASDTRLLGEVSFLRLSLRGAFLTRASSLSISTLVGLLSSSMACTEMLDSLVSAACLVTIDEASLTIAGIYYVVGLSPQFHGLLQGNEQYVQEGLDLENVTDCTQKLLTGMSCCRQVSSKMNGLTWVRHLYD